MPDHPVGEQPHNFPSSWYRVRWIAVACAVGASAFGSTSLASAQLRVEAASIDSIFAGFMGANAPGCAVGVYDGAEVLHARGYGMADLEREVPMTDRTVLNVGSVAKQFTAAVVLQLAHGGRLSLDDEIREHLPELPQYDGTITIRHLLHHTSGLRDPFIATVLAGRRLHDVITAGDILHSATRLQALNHSPGAEHLYNTGGYVLLAEIVRRVEGRSFAEVAADRIFLPLGMQSTQIRDDHTELVPGRAEPYAPAGGSEFALNATQSDFAGATGLYTSVHDLARWNGALAAAFGEKIPAGSAVVEAGIAERGRLADGSEIGYAFGISHGSHRGVPTLEHRGEDGGFRSFLLHFPESGVGVAVLCNRADTAPWTLGTAVADRLPALSPIAAVSSRYHAASPQMPDVGTGAISTGVTPEASAVDPRSLVGTYWNEARAQVRQVSLREGRLTIDGLPLESLGDGRFAAGSNGVVAFASQPIGTELVENRDGRITRFLLMPVPDSPDALDGRYRNSELEVEWIVRWADGGLRLFRPALGQVPLQPLFQDAFGDPFGTIRFQRDATGEIESLEYTTSGIRRLRFDRVGP